jgi:hypothetical protein
MPGRAKRLRRSRPATGRMPLLALGSLRTSTLKPPVGYGPFQLHSLAVSSTYGRGPRWRFNQRHTLLADAVATDRRAPADVAHRRGDAFARFDLGPDQRGELRRPQPARYSGSAERASSLLCGARTRAPQRNRRCPARATLWHQKIASAGRSAASNSLRGAAGSARSAAMEVAFISRARARPASRATSLRTGRAPSATRALAIPRPMPDAVFGGPSFPSRSDFGLIARPARPQTE